MHANGFAYVGCAHTMQAERNSSFIEMGVEAGRSLERSNVELVRIFERDFGFVGDGLGHGTDHLLCNGRLIEHPQPANYDLDQLRAAMYPHPEAVPRGRCRPRAGSWRLRRLDGPQIKQERTRVLAREAKRRHIRMANHQPFTQPLHERIKIDSAIERAKGGGASVRTLTAFTDRMALRAHPFRQRAAALLQRA